MIDLEHGIGINACIISGQLGMQPILEWLARFIKKSKQFNHNDITSEIATLTLLLSVKEPLHSKTSLQRPRSVKGTSHRGHSDQWPQWPFQCHLITSSLQIYETGRCREVSLYFLITLSHWDLAPFNAWVTHIAPSNTGQGNFTPTTHWWFQVHIL